MAKAAKEKDKEPEKKGGATPFKSVEFGVKKLAETEDLKGMKASDIRVLLRGDDELREEFRKDDNWDFGNQKNVDRVAKKLKKAHAERQAKRAAANSAGKDEEEKDEKLAAKGKGKK
jgi:hypothetical protein